MRDGHFLKTSCGSPNYAAPEVISGKLYAGPEVDVWSCGVILYALLCGSLPFDDENIPNLFKKIKNGIYFLPSHLSPGSRDLIPKMLIVDPLKRITIPEIRQHPWFSTHLPRYLAVTPPDSHTQSVRVDSEVLNIMTRMGFDEASTLDSVNRRLGDKAAVAYSLIVDNRHRISSGYLGKEFSEGLDDDLVQTDSLINNVYNVNEKAGSMNSQVNSTSTRLLNQRVCVTERRWALGINYRASPSELMAELLKILRAQNIMWKRGPGGIYNIKCLKPLQQMHQQQVQMLVLPANVLKFELQIYRDRNSRYVLDIQRIEGHMYTFLDVVRAIILEFKS